MLTLPDDATYFKLPLNFRCPECGRRALWCEIDEWLDDGIPTETGVHVSCRNERRGDHWNQPYISLLPLEHRVYRWCLTNVRIVESEAATRERLRAWNAGEAIRGAR